MLAIKVCDCNCDAGAYTALGRGEGVILSADPRTEREEKSLWIGWGKALYSYALLRSSLWGAVFRLLYYWLDLSLPGHQRRADILALGV